MQAKTQQLQIRVSPREKAALRQLARAAGLDVSAYVLSRVLTAEPDRLAGILRSVANDDDRRFALAELHDLLAGLTPATFGPAVERADVRDLPAVTRNYVAAMVEHTAAALDVAPPAWCRSVEPLDTPYFATPLKGLRPHLLQASPAAFKRRNLFVDSTVGARV